MELNKNTCHEVQKSTGLGIRKKYRSWIQENEDYEVKKMKAQSLEKYMSLRKLQAMELRKIQIMELRNMHVTELEKHRPWSSEKQWSWS